MDMAQLAEPAVAMDMALNRGKFNLYLPLTPGSSGFTVCLPIVQPLPKTAGGPGASDSRWCYQSVRRLSFELLNSHH